jgi:tocopherol O-methyltransferase
VVCSWLAKENVDWWQRRWLLEPICREGRIPHLLCAPELIAEAEAAGLTAGEWQDLTDRVRRTWPIVVWRFIRRLALSRRYRSFLLDSSRRNRVFSLTIARIWAAYWTGAMRYGLFRFTKHE